MSFPIGLGYRRSLTDELLSGQTLRPDFVELAPENWMGVGGLWKRRLNAVAEKYPILCHGLSLSIGSPDPLNKDFIKKVKEFLDEYQVEIYSEHLSFSQCENAHLYDLLPIPFRKDAIQHITERIHQVQDLLGRRLVLENVSYYLTPHPEMTELEFIQEIGKASDCQFLLDVNNVYVNAFNHGYDAKEFIDGFPMERVAYIHMAGHHKISDDLIIDTHGAEIIDPVYDLFSYTVGKINPVPVLLERDFNIPEAHEIAGELTALKQRSSNMIQSKTS